MALFQSPRAGERGRRYRLLAVSMLNTGHRCNDHGMIDVLSCVTLSLCFVLQFFTVCRVQRSDRIECLARHPAERPSYARRASGPLSSHTSLTHPSLRPRVVRHVQRLAAAVGVCVLVCGSWTAEATAPVLRSQA